LYWRPTFRTTQKIKILEESPETPEGKIGNSGNSGKIGKIGIIGTIGIPHNISVP
jgi:hypothetical protein